MGKKWDRFVPQPSFWKEVLRVLKPGGHVLAFFGSRTYDWGTMAMRIAGFEIRDQIQWIYGSGFPKSLNVSKAFDSLAGAERKVIGKREHPTLKNKINIARINSDQFHGRNSVTIKDEWDLTENATPEAVQWDGWGTALKPAHEPICLARKPLIGTICETILAWGVGAININACRIPFVNTADKVSATWGRGTDIMGGNFVGGIHTSGYVNIEANARGRWPANIIFDEAAAEILDEQAGELSSGSMKKAYTYKNTGYSMSAPSGETRYITDGDKGSASRFFYVAKASRSERNLGLEKFVPTEREERGNNQAMRVCVTCGITDNGYADHSKCSGEFTYRQSAAVANIHPTVKPIKLMQYLVKMVTPLGGHVLDPFNGSGTTGIACKLEGFDYTGMDEEKKYIDISEARIKAHYEPEPTLF